MTTGLITIYNSLLYYCCLLLLTRYILSCTPRKCILLSSFLVFIPLIIFSLTENVALFLPVYVAFEVGQFLLIKLSFKKVKLRLVLLSYVLLYCINMIFTSVFAAVFPSYRYHIDYLINTATVLLCAILCLTKLRHAIQQALEWAPRYILIISTLLLISAAAVSVFISGFQHFIYPEIWNRWLQVITSFLLMAICIILPVIFIISISNTRLKTLTADYEQQIHAQAAHYKNLASANYEVRRFRHDFKNMRIAIESLLQDGEQTRALALLRQCADALETPGGLRPVFDTGNGIADALLTDKQKRAAACGADLQFSGVIPPDALSPTDLCVILGNTLDNAIEACEKLSDPAEKTVRVTAACNSGFLFLTVQNPIGEPVIIHNNRIATTKDNKTLHGFGLYSLHAVIRKYGGQMTLSATEDAFTVEIDLDIMSTSKLPVS